MPTSLLLASMLQLSTPLWGCLTLALAVKLIYRHLNDSYRSSTDHSHYTYTYNLNTLLQCSCDSPRRASPASYIHESAQYIRGTARKNVCAAP